MTILNSLNRPVEAVTTAQDLRAQTLNMIKRIGDSAIDAFCYVEDTPTALKTELMANALLSRPLKGLPIAIKEVIDVAGVPGGYGCAAFADRVPLVSADIVIQLERLGAQVIGVTRATEMALAGRQRLVTPGRLTTAPVARPVVPLQPLVQDLFRLLWVPRRSVLLFVQRLIAVWLALNHRSGSVQSMAYCH